MEHFFVTTVKDVIFDLGVSFRSLKSKSEDVEHTLHSMFGRRYPVDYQDDEPADDGYNSYKSMSQTVNWGIFEELARAAESGDLMEKPEPPTVQVELKTDTPAEPDQVAPSGADALSSPSISSEPLQAPVQAPESPAPQKEAAPPANQGTDCYAQSRPLPLRCILSAIA
jgi:hypothetical protein